MHQPSNSAVFARLLAQLQLVEFLGSGVNLKLRVFLVRHGSPRTGTTLMENLRVEPARYFSGLFEVVDVEINNYCDT